MGGALPLKTSCIGRLEQFGVSLLSRTDAELSVVFVLHWLKWIESRREMLPSSTGHQLLVPWVQAWKTPWQYLSSKLTGMQKYELRIISWLLSKGGRRSPCFQNASRRDGQEGPCISLKNSASCLVGHPGCAGWWHIYPPFPFPSTSLHLNKKSNSVFQIFSRLLFLGEVGSIVE